MVAPPTHGQRAWRLPLALAPLRHRDYALLWTASLVSNVGTWMEIVAIGSLLARHTGRASDLGVLAAAGFLPTALFSPIGGVIADRVRRKRFLLQTLAVDTVLACVLALLLATGAWTPAILWAIVFIEGCSTSLSMPNRQALMPDLVPPEELLAAVGLSSTAWNGGRVLGPLLAGLLIAATSTTWAVIANAASFVVMLIAATFIRLPERARATGPIGMFTRIAEGAAAVCSNPRCRFALLSVVGLSLSAAPFIGLLPIVAHNTFKGGAGTTSLFVTAQGLGAIIGALSVPRLASMFGRERVILGALLTLCPSLLLYGLGSSTAVAALALVVIGGAYFAVLVSTQGMLQAEAPAALKARALSMFSVALGLGYVVSVTVNGYAADAWSLRGVHVAQGVLSAIAASALWAYSHQKGHREAESTR